MKKSMIIYSTCQGIIFQRILNEHARFNELFTIEYFSNFSSPGNSQFNISEEKLKQCDVFLYHPIKNIGDGRSTEDIIQILPSNTLAFILPYVTFSAYWPDFEIVPRSPLGINKNRPYGSIPYRSVILESIIDKYTNSNKQIISEYLDKYEEISILANTGLKDTYRYLNNVDKQPGPFSIGKYIEENYQEQHLFHIFNHPKIEIYYTLVNQLLEYLGFKLLPENRISNVLGHMEQNLPIHPATVETHKLKFISQGHKYKYLDQQYTFEEFISFYADEYTKKIKGNNNYEK